MGNNKRRRRDESRRERDRQDDSSSTYMSSSDEALSAKETTRRRSSGALVTPAARRKTKEKEDIGITIFNELKKIRKKLKNLTESHQELRKLLEPNINGSSGDDSSPRSELNEGNELKYRLKIDCQVHEKIDKGRIVETNLGKTIRVTLYDDRGEIVRTGPLSYAKVMLVIVNGDFNQHGDHDGWSKKDFERNIRRPQQGNFVAEDVNQPVQSIVSNCIFKLAGGEQYHSDATILYNSRNQKVKLGVMVLSPTEERVLEGLSNPFKVRDPVKPGRKKQAPRGNDPNDSRTYLGLDPSTVVPSAGPSTSASILQSPFSHMMMYRTSMNQPPCNPSGLQPSETPQQHSRTIVVPSAEQNPILQGHFPPPTMSDTNIDQATCSLRAEGEQSSPCNFWDGTLMDAANAGGEQSWALNDLWQGMQEFHENGTQFMNQTIRPALIVRDWPLDHFMPLYSHQPKCNYFGLPTMRLMKEPSNPLTIIPKEVMQTHRRTGVHIEPLEPDYSDEEQPLKRRLNSKYRLQFVNEVCEDYYTGDLIKANDGNHIKVALFDENNTKITSGLLSSAHVEIVVLHGNFNVDGQDYWTSEEFSRSTVCPGPGKEGSVLGGDRILVLADGEACLDDSFFKITSFRARSGKFKLGVMMASAQDERIHEGISEPFLVKNRHPSKALPPGFRFLPTDQELISYYLYERANSERAAVAPCPAPAQDGRILEGTTKTFVQAVLRGLRFGPMGQELIDHYLCGRATAAPAMAEVDIYKFDPWELPAKALFGGDEWYFLCPWKPEDGCSERAAGSGYWEDTGTDVPISIADDQKVIGFKKTLVFYTGRRPNRSDTGWIMHEYRRADETYSATTSSSKGPSSTSSIKLDEWVLCRIYNKRIKEHLSTLVEDDEPGQPTQEYLSYNVLPPGFSFHPMEVELLSANRSNPEVDTMKRWVEQLKMTLFIPEVDVYEYEPWDLPSTAKLSDNEWYFFSSRDRKYATGYRTNRATQSGYWKATGKDRPISTNGNRRATGRGIDDDVIGFRKKLVFYMGRAPKGTKTRWIMHEYRLAENTYRNTISSIEGSSSTLSDRVQEYVLCRIYEDANNMQSSPFSREHDGLTYDAFTYDYDVDRDLTDTDDNGLTDEDIHDLTDADLSA